MKGIIYFIQPVELIGTCIYKIGCSRNPNLDRCKKGYRKGSRYISIMECNNPFELERKIINNFLIKFKLFRGYEYFSGNEKDMLKEFLKITNLHEQTITLSDNYIVNDYDNTNYDNKYNEIVQFQSPEEIKGNIVKLLYLNKDNLTEFEKLLVLDDKILEKVFNLILLLKNKTEEILLVSIAENLFFKTIKNKYKKIKICKEIMKILMIDDLHKLNKNLTKNFNNIIYDEWIKDNINTIKKTFDIRTNKYNNFTYYNIYLLLITILKNFFDIRLFIRKEIQINKVKHIYHILNENVLSEHISIINKLNNSDIFIDFI